MHLVRHIDLARALSLQLTPHVGRRNNGTWYQGRWKNDTRQGLGKIAWKGGGYYEGEWKEGFQDGNGTLHTRSACSRSFLTGIRLLLFVRLSGAHRASCGCGSAGTASHSKASGQGAQLPTLRRMRVHTRMLTRFSLARNELNGRGIKSWFEQGKLEVYEGDFKQTKVLPSPHIRCHRPRVSP
jgi:hypothetical protein